LGRTRPYGLPEHSIATCLELAERAGEVDAVAIVRPIPESDFHLKLRAQFPQSRIVLVEHHRAHAASAYYPSPFEMPPCSRSTAAAISAAARAGWPRARR
jgi:predicted NodU family carbamoyl transferase